MTAIELIAEANRLGVVIVLDGADRVRLRGPADTIEALRTHAPSKAEIIAVLRQREVRCEGPALPERDVMCSKCAGARRCYAVVDGKAVCAQCVEWTVEGCVTYTTLGEADEQGVQEWGACVACGTSWAAHGRPDVRSWRRVPDADDVSVLTVKFVIASARRIAEGARS